MYPRIEKFNFTKELRKKKSSYHLDIKLPISFHNIDYKIYGAKGFMQTGSFSGYNNNGMKNRLCISFSKLQTIFISIYVKGETDSIEFFDFIEIPEEEEEEEEEEREKQNLDKNIKIVIEKKPSYEDFFNMEIPRNNRNCEEEDEEEEENDEEEIQEEEINPEDLL